jgi:hypothetical protein
MDKDKKLENKIKSEGNKRQCIIQAIEIPIESLS